MRRLVLAALAGAAALALSSAVRPGRVAAPLTYVHAGRLLADPATGRVLTEQTLVVQDGRIVRIEAG